METETSEMHRSFKTKSSRDRNRTQYLTTTQCSAQDAHGLLQREGERRASRRKERAGGRQKEGKEGGKGAVAATRVLSFKIGYS